MQHQTFAPESPPQIEARLEADRKALSQALTALGSKFMPEALWSNGLSVIKANSGAYTHVLDRAIRANPSAVILTAVGLAWLILGRRSAVAAHDIPLPGTHVEAVARWEDEGGPVTETLAETPGPDQTWIHDADRLRRRANILIAQIDAAMRKNLIPAAQLARHRADVVAALTQDVRRTIARGLDHLTTDARALALAGRERAYAIHVQPPKTALRDKPLATGALLAAAGAALAAVLPQSTVENDAFGGARDQLVDTARQAIAEERQRLAHAAQRIAQSLLADAPKDRR